MSNLFVPLQRKKNPNMLNLVLRNLQASNNWTKFFCYSHPFI
jgi:hypothetical protein